GRRGAVPGPGTRERRRDAHLHRAGRVVTVQLLHLSDLHFGSVAELEQIEGLEQMVPDLRPDAVVVTGDLSQRARHGELQRARALVHAAARTAPVLVMPGNHDVAWWLRPLIPFAKEPLYAKYRRYFGADLTPTLTLPGGGAIIASALTSHGVAWGSLTPRLRDLAVKGHLPKREITRVRGLFEAGPPGQARVLALHHNVLRGDLSRRGGRPQSFSFVTIEPTAIHITFFRWDAETRRFRASDTAAFARARAAVVAPAAPPVTPVAG